MPRNAAHDAVMRSEMSSIVIIGFSAASVPSLCSVYGESSSVFSEVNTAESMEETFSMIDLGSAGSGVPSSDAAIPTLVTLTISSSQSATSEATGSIAGSEGGSYKDFAALVLLFLLPNKPMFDV